MTQNAATDKALAAVNPGPGRWWKVELVKNAAKDPIRVTLMEEVVPGRRAFSTPLGYRRTIATPSKVAEAADEVLAAVGGYLAVVGEYPLVSETINPNNKE